MSFKVVFAFAMVALLVAAPTSATMMQSGQRQHRKLLQSLAGSFGTNIGVPPQGTFRSGGGPLSSRGDFTSETNIRDNQPPLASGSFNSQRGGSSGSGASTQDRGSGRNSGGISSSVSVGGRH